MTKGLWLALPLLLLAGCASTSAPQPTLADRYQAALEDAALIEPGEDVPLATPAKGTIRVVTWTKYPDSFPRGRYVTTNWGDTWVTLDGDVKRFCKAYQNKIGQTQALLGLPQVAGEQRQFVTLEVKSAELFRPCADPDTGKLRCTAGFPAKVPASHLAWYAEQVATAYQADGFPWTRLGYTYNYNIGASEVGPTEFVLPKGSRAKVVSAIATVSYCQ